jgi:hypothetical protein
MTEFAVLVCLCVYLPDDELVGVETCRRDTSNFTGSGFGGLEGACWPLERKFSGSNPAETVGFFKAKKSPAHLPSKGK